MLYNFFGFCFWLTMGTAILSGVLSGFGVLPGNLGSTTFGYSFLASMMFMGFWQCTGLMSDLDRLGRIRAERIALQDAETARRQEEIRRMQLLRSRSH